MKRPALLIVDDEAVFLTTLEAFFRTRGYHVWTAATGEAALQVVRQHQPQVVLLDLCLGQGNLQGFEVLRQLKTQWPELIVFMCSASADPEHHARAQRLGAARFFDKPVHLTELLRAVKEANGHPCQS